MTRLRQGFAGLAWPFRFSRAARGESGGTNASPPAEEFVSLAHLPEEAMRFVVARRGRCGLTVIDCVKLDALTSNSSVPRGILAAVDECSPASTIPLPARPLVPTRDRKRVQGREAGEQCLSPVTQ